MNFRELAQRLHRETQRSTPAPTTVVTTDIRHLRLIDALKDAWRDIQMDRSYSGWKWMRQTLDATLVIGQQVYSGTSDFGAERFGRWRRQTADYWPIVYVDGSPNSQWDVDWVQLDFMRQEWIYINHGPSVPLAWSVDEQERLVLGPSPSAAYKLRIDYLKAPYELGTGNADPNLDAPDMPEEYHMLLVWKALQDTAISDAKPEVLARAERGYSDLFYKLLRMQALEIPGQ